MLVANIRAGLVANIRDLKTERVTFEKEKQQNGREKPLLVISIDFEGSLAEELSEQFLSGSISAKAEDAGGRHEDDQTWPVSREVIREEVTERAHAGDHDSFSSKT